MTEQPRLATQGIIARRTNYGEADRILTLITPQGKLRALVRGVRKPKSRMAGGLSALSVCQLTILKGKGELDHIISTRQAVSWPSLVNDYDATMLAYELIEQVNRLLENEAESDYFELLVEALTALDAGQDRALIELGFRLRLLKLLGHQPELRQDANGQPLDSKQTYSMIPEEGTLQPDPAGTFDADAIKGWRVLLSLSLPQAGQVKGLSEVATRTLPLAKAFFAELYNR